MFDEGCACFDEARACWMKHHMHWPVVLGSCNRAVEIRMYVLLQCVNQACGVVTAAVAALAGSPYCFFGNASCPFYLVLHCLYQFQPLEIAALGACTGAHVLLAQKVVVLAVKGWASCLSLLLSPS
jgi:molybdopterin/thiamine biosynthesis adenylyltransferase